MHVLYSHALFYISQGPESEGPAEPKEPVLRSLNSTSDSPSYHFRENENEKVYPARAKIESTNYHPYTKTMSLCATTVQ